MKLIMHIGSPKTGTTSIQQFLNDNEDALREADIHYVKAFRRGISHNLLMNLLRKGEADFVKRKLNQELNSTPHKYAILSSELFFLPMLSRQLMKLIPNEIAENAQIICYLRRQDRYLEALYKQMLKKGVTDQSPSDFLEKRFNKLIYKVNLEIYADKFGAKRMSIRAFERDKLAGRDAVSDFLHVTGIDKHIGFRPGEGQSNPTMSHPMTLAFSRYNWENPVEMRNTLRWLSAHADQKWFKSNDVYNFKEQEEILDRFMPGNEYISKTFLDGAPLFSLDDVKEENNNAITDPKEFDKAVEEAREVIIKARAEIA